MPLDNFYEKSDRSAKRRGLTVGSIFLGLGIYLAAGYYFFAPRADKTLYEQPPEVRVANLEVLFAGLPRPDGFEFVKREPPVELENGTAVVYRFRSDREQDELLPVFALWFADHGWEPLGESGSWRRGDQTVTVREVYSDFANFEIYCHEEKISFGIY